MSTWSKYLRVWVVVGAYLLVVFALILLQGLLDLNGLWPSLNSLSFFLVFHTLAVIAVFFAIWRVFQPPEIRQTKLYGIPAAAQVLESNRTKWRWRRFSGPWAREYRLRLQVTPPDRAPFPATTYAYFSPGSEPAVGAVIRVKIHPRRKNLVVVTTPDQVRDKS
ncbi:MAG: hypothetical protein IT331_04985 [Anaerolineae bacterium]|nr:hypothetical protein [Anaerolineae bacterium]